MTGEFDVIDLSAFGSGSRVLVIDASPVFRASLAGFLRRQRFEVATAASGEEGLRVFQHFGPTLCIIDLLPAGRITGLQAAEQMYESDPSLRFIFLTACPEFAGIERPAFLRTAPLLGKPVRLGDLAFLIRRVLLPQPRPPPGAIHGPSPATAWRADLPSTTRHHRGKRRCLSALRGEFGLSSRGGRSLVSRSPVSRFLEHRFLESRFLEKGGPAWATGTTSVAPSSPC